MDITKSITSLSNYQEFSEFIHQIYFLREEAISSLFQAKVDDVMQISGQILAYDQILKMVNSEVLFARHQ